MHKPDQDTKAVDAKAVNGAARSGRKRRKRRRWSAEEKIRITRESFASSETITAVAARYPSVLMLSSVFRRGRIETNHRMHPDSRNKLGVGVTVTATDFLCVRWKA